MVENLILIGIGMILGAITVIVLMYAFARWRIASMTSKLDRADKILRDMPPLDPDAILRMVEDLDDDEFEFEDRRP